MAQGAWKKGVQNMESILEGLTPPQRTAVQHRDGPLMILAGPGSGKTRVVTRRIANLLHQGVQPWQIVALTFTNKAADEMRSRVEQLAPGQPVWMGTFHRFCVRLLRRYAPLVGLRENFSIYDTSDAKAAMKRAIEAANIQLSHLKEDRIANLISRAKNRMITPEQMAQGMGLGHGEQAAAEVYRVYQEHLLRANAADFDDLLLHVAKLLHENPDLRSELDDRYRYIMVDEYQDTNSVQYTIVHGLSLDHRNLAVTGDPDQSIYGWRGANVQNILDFEQHYPDVQVVRLEQNYRSTPEILRVADQLIRNNRKRKHKDLFTERPNGAGVRLRTYENSYREADDIADQISLAVHSRKRRPKDFAIFCRTAALTRNFEHALRSRGLPYHVSGAVEFYQRKEVKDVIAYLLLLENPANDVALLRIINRPARGIGQKTLDALREYADRRRLPLLEAARKAGLIDGIPKRSAVKIAQFVNIYDQLAARPPEPLHELIEVMLRITGYRAMLEAGESDIAPGENSPLANVDELISAVTEVDRVFPPGEAIQAFLEQVALVSDTDDLDGDQDWVNVMTLHAAKGLEYPCVFIVAVEDGLLPHSRSKDDPDQLEEERRLLFVGITRAEEELQLSWAQTRILRGDARHAIPSSFLMELPREEMDQVQAGRLMFERMMNPDAFHDDDSHADGDYPSDWDDVHHEPVDHEPVIDVSGKSVSDQPVAPLSALRTAAQMLEGGGASRIPPNGYRTGMVVTHTTYGSGRIKKVTGQGARRTAVIEFFSDGVERTFRLAFANLTVEE